MNAQIERSYSRRIPDHERDRGVMLPIVLVITVVMSVDGHRDCQRTCKPICQYGRVTVDPPIGLLPPMRS